MTEELLRKVWSRVQDRIVPVPEAGCMLWEGAVLQNGYGYVRAGSRFFYLHRLSWIVANGLIPNGLCVCHKCDTRRCVNPTHLFVGSHKDNFDDCRRKGRNKPIAPQYGEKHHAASITEGIVRFIFSSRLDNITAAHMFGIKPCHVDLIRRRGVWKETTNDLETVWIG